MNSDDIDKAYVSPYDKFLFEFDATHNKSASQIKEINKHKRIFLMRDNKDYENKKSEIWEEF
ncbi:TPA: CBU_0585 family protein [Legionella anisa]